MQHNYRQFRNLPFLKPLLLGKVCPAQPVFWLLVPSVTRLDFSATQNLKYDFKRASSPFSEASALISEPPFFMLSIFHCVTLQFSTMQQHPRTYILYLMGQNRPWPSCGQTKKERKYQASSMMMSSIFISGRFLVNLAR